MLRLFGVNLPEGKSIFIALTYIYGIGKTRSAQILAETGIDPNKKVRDISEEEAAKIRKFIEKHYVVEGDLRQQIREDIERLKRIKAWRGIRHIVGLPVRGQKTRRNARSHKGRARPVAGLNVKATK